MNYIQIKTAQALDSLVTFAKIFLVLVLTFFAFYFNTSQASPYLAFEPKLGGFKIELPKNQGYWKLTGPIAAPYKNDILQKFQDKMSAAGIPRSEQKWYVAQLVQENGALTADRLGDHGCSFGLIQYNACAHNHVKATRFLKDHPEWKSVDHQLQVMTDWIVARREIYHGNVKQVIIHHNSPACAARNCKDTNVHYYKSISAKVSLLSL